MYKPFSYKLEEDISEEMGERLVKQILKFAWGKNDFGKSENPN